MEENVPSWLLELYQKHGKTTSKLIFEGKGARKIADTLGITRHKATILARYIQEHSGDDTNPTVSKSEESRPLYEYRTSTEDFVFTLPQRTGTLVLSADQVRQMKVDYTNWDGHGQTMEQVAMAHGLTTHEFEGVKSVLGWRKSSLPLLDEDMKDMSETDIEERLFALKKRGAEVKAKRRIWNMVEEKARSYDQIMSGDVKPIETALQNIFRNHVPPQVVEVPQVPMGEWALVFSPTDLHYGKYHWAQYGGGPKFDREGCRARLFEATQNMIQRLPSRPEVVISCIGSDWFNADNIQAKTSSATHTMDMDGTPEQMWEEGMALCIDIHELIRPLAKEVWIVLQRGNHDDILSGAMFSVLQAWFRNDPHVKFHDGRGPYNYLQYGQSMIQVTHGHGEHRAEKLANIMAHERPQMWGRTKYKYCLTGNLHHHSIHESGGAICFLLPSLTGSDRWSTKHGYMMARPGLMGLCFDKKTGYMASIFGHVSDELIPVPQDEFSENTLG